MAMLNIRDLPEEVHARLRVRAARAGRSMEAEARAILEEACKEETSRATTLRLTLDLPAWVDQVFGAASPTDVAAELIAERRAEASRE